MRKTHGVFECAEAAQKVDRVTFLRRRLACSWLSPNRVKTSIHFDLRRTKCPINQCLINQLLKTDAEA